MVAPGDTVTFIIPDECTHLIEYYSVDNVGNTETTKSQIVNVDDTQPTTIVDIEYGEIMWAFDRETGQFKQIRTIKQVTVTADDGDGVDHCTIHYATLGSHGGLVWHAGKNPIVFRRGDLERVIMYYSEDILGNREKPNKAGWIKPIK
jgi:plastocyanin